MKGNGLKKCSAKCMKNKKACVETNCRHWINFPTEYNCCLVSIYENGNMTLGQVGERIGVSFSRIKQIETAALKKLKRNSLLDS